MIFIFLIILVGFIVLLGVKKYRFEKNDLVNIIFLGVISCLVSAMLSQTIGIIIPGLDNKFSLAFPIIYYLLLAGIPEEVSKFLMIKLSKPKTKTAIFINGIFISILFTVFEDFLYFSAYEMNPLFRMLAPGHITFQLFMILFLFKAYDFKEKNNKSMNILFNGLAVVVPAILHGIYDGLAGASVRWLLYIIGIITYIIIIVYIIRIDGNNEVENKKISALSIIKIIIIVLISLFIVFATNPDNKYHSLNKEVNIREEKIYLTIEDFEEYEEKNAFFDKDNGYYTRIKIKIRNDSNEKKKISKLAFNLYDGDESVRMVYTKLDGDALPEEVSANSVIEGYLYFNGKYKDTYYLTYKTNSLSITEESNIYYFNIKK